MSTQPNPTQTELVKEHAAAELAAVLKIHADYSADVEKALIEAEEAITHAENIRNQLLSRYQSLPF